MVSWLARQPYSFLLSGDLKLVNHTDITFRLDGLYADLHAGNLWKFPLMQDTTVASAVRQATYHWDSTCLQVVLCGLFVVLNNLG